MSTANILTAQRRNSTMQHSTATKIINTMQCPALGNMLPHAHSGTPRTTSAFTGHLNATQCSGQQDPCRAAQLRGDGEPMLPWCMWTLTGAHLDMHLLRNRGQLIPVLQRQTCAQGDLLHLAVCSLVCLDCGRPVCPELCQCACLHRTVWLYMHSKQLWCRAVFGYKVRAKVA